MGTTIAERTKMLIESQHLNEYSFSKKIGKSNTAVQKIVKGESKPGFDMLETIFQVFPDLNREWYLEGIGSMWKTIQIQPTRGDDYLREYLLELETKFMNLLQAKDRQLENKDEQIAGMQRTIDTLLGKSNGVPQNLIVFESDTKVMPLNREQMKKGA